MRQRIKAAMAQAFRIPAVDVPDDATFGRLRGWDSIGHITLMMTLEAEFGVVLSAEAIQVALTLPLIEDCLRALQRDEAPTSRSQ